MDHFNVTCEKHDGPRQASTPLEAPDAEEPDLWAIQGRCNAAGHLIARRDGVDSISDQTRSDINALLGYVVRLRLALETIRKSAGFAPSSEESK